MYRVRETVYDCHLVHARMMVVFDLVQRWLRASELRSRTAQYHGYRRQDPSAGRLKTKERSRALTARFIRAMDEDTAPSESRSPISSRAPPYVPGMLEMIAALEGRELAYRANNGDGTRRSKLPGYGKLSGRSLDELRAGERVEVG